MLRLAAAVVVTLAASASLALAAAPPFGQPQGHAVQQNRGTKPAGAPPPVLNVVHHRLKRGASSNYQTLEASIVAAYDRAKVPRFHWLTFQSTKDARDVLYLNLASTVDEFHGLADSWPTVSAAHPELPRLQQRLEKLIESQTSTLTTRRDDIEYGRTDVDFASMRALLLTTVHVTAGHEGRFVEAVRRASGNHTPWVLYEATEESTFVLVAPLKSRAEAKRTAPVPRAVKSLKGVYRDIDTRLYALAASMSRVPEAFVPPRPRNASPGPLPR